MEPKAPSFATCLSCMDGRVTLPVTQFIRETHGVQFVDYITEAGMDGFISHFGPLDGILRKIDISFQKHGSRVAYVVGHADCSGNPVDNDRHRQDILSAIERLRVFRSFTAIGGLFVSKDWKVFPVTSVPSLTLPATRDNSTPLQRITQVISASALMQSVSSPTTKNNSILKCPFCGAPNEIDSNFCDQCAKSLHP